MRSSLLLLVLLLSGLAYADNALQTPTMAISEQGVGPLNKNTPFDQRAVQKIFPMLKVTRSVSSTEGEEFSILKVSDDKGLLFTINPDGDSKGIFSVLFEKNRIPNRLGNIVGDRYKRIYQGHAGECSLGEEEYAGTVICLAPGSKHVYYLFNGTWDGSDFEMPPAGILGAWTISAILWKP